MELGPISVVSSRLHRGMGNKMAWHVHNGKCAEKIFAENESTKR